MKAKDKGKKMKRLLKQLVRFVGNERKASRIEMRYETLKRSK